MFKSLVAVVPYRNSKNNLPQVKLVVIEGAQLPERLIFQSAKFASMSGLNVGDEKLILWDTNGTETYDGVTRPKYRYDVLSGGKYSDAFVVETAKVAAKAIAKFSPKFQLGGSSTTSVAGTPTAVVNPADAIVAELTVQLDALAELDDEDIPAVEALVVKARTELSKYPVALADFLKIAKEKVNATV